MTQVDPKSDVQPAAKPAVEPAYSIPAALQSMPMPDAAAAAAAAAKKREDDETSDKVVAYSFWFFLGFFGAHRFWWGKWKTALAQMCLPLVGVVMIIVGGGSALATLDGEVALAAGGVAIVGGLMVLGVFVWVFLDVIFIAMWKPKSSEPK